MHASFEVTCGQETLRQAWLLYNYPGADAFQIFKVDTTFK